MSKKTISELEKNHKKLPAKKEKWTDMGDGIITDNGNSELYNTGNWSDRELQFCDKNCIDCGMCWPICPDDAIIYDENGSMIGVDLDHCKNCGLCVEICPTTMNKDKSKHALFFEEKTEKDF